MQKVKDLYKHIPGFLKNKYAVTIILFLLWILFFDSNDLISQVKLRLELSDLRSQKEYYQDKIEEVRTDRKELLTNKENLEKFAREKYWMKKDNEDIFIIVEEE